VIKKANIFITYTLSFLLACIPR